MAVSRPPEAGTLLIAALLIMVLAFSGYWITTYADPDTAGRPWDLVRWFLYGAGAIIGVALVMYLRRGRG